MHPTFQEKILGILSKSARLPRVANPYLVAALIFEGELRSIEIARETGIAHQTVNFWKRKLGIRKRHFKADESVKYPLIKEAHDRMGITRANRTRKLNDLADLAGYNQATLRAMFYYGRTPYLHTFVDIVNALGGTVRIDWDDNRKQSRKATPGPAQKV